MPKYNRLSSEHQAMHDRDLGLSLSNTKTSSLNCSKMLNMPRGYNQSLLSAAHSHGSPKAPEQHRNQERRPPSEDDVGGCARRLVTSSRVTEVVRTHVRELAVLGQQSVVGADVADI